MVLSELLVLVLVTLFVIKGFLLGVNREFPTFITILLSLTLSLIFQNGILSLFSSGNDDVLGFWIFSAMNLLIAGIGVVTFLLLRNEAGKKTPSLFSRISGGLFGIAEGGVFTVLLVSLLYIQPFISPRLSFLQDNRFIDFIVMVIPQLR